MTPATTLADAITIETVCMSTILNTDEASFDSAQLSLFRNITTGLSTVVWLGWGWVGLGGKLYRTHKKNSRDSNCLQTVMV
jgi:hypothetical protein